MEKENATKGTIARTEDMHWVVNFEMSTGNRDSLSLHPDDVEAIENASMVFDNMEARIESSPEVLFTVVEHRKMDGLVKYAKLVKEI